MKSVPWTAPRLLRLWLALGVMAALAAPAACKRRTKPPSQQDAVEDVALGPAAFLTPLLEAGQYREAQNASRLDPPLLGDLESYSGFLTVDKERDSNLFFWFFPAEKGMEDAPVVLWLQGGPGSSGLLGVFLENGPIKLRKGRRLKRRRHSWTRAASMLYVDSPVGTGFSFTKDPEGLAASSDQVGHQLHVLLLQFFQLFPQLQGNEFFIAGESYGGKYAPALAMAIHTANNNNNSNNTRVNLKGLALGNPLADPESMLEYGDYLYQLGLVDEQGRQQFKEREDHIRALLQQRRWVDAWRERDALIGRSSGDSNSTLFRDLTGFRYRFNYLHDQDYLQRGYKQFVQLASVRQLLHVGNLTYHNRSAVAERLRPDVMQSARPQYEFLLEHYPVLFYNGQLDVVDPYPLMVSFLRRLQWSGAEEYRVAPRRHWAVDGELAGYVKTAGKLTEVLVRAAGHMVPTDQPKWALDLVTKFVSHKPIAP